MWSHRLSSHRLGTKRDFCVLLLSLCLQALASFVGEWSQRVGQTVKKQSRNTTACCVWGGKKRCAGLNEHQEGAAGRRGVASRALVWGRGKHRFSPVLNVLSLQHALLLFSLQ